jgi:hypothetical protein
MTLNKAVQDLLDRLPTTAELEWPSLQAAIYGARYTGPMTVHFLNGVPRQIDLGAPVRLSICHGDGPADQRRGLTTDGAVVQAEPC